MENGLTTRTPGPSTKGRTAMEEYIGLDVSMKETAVSIRRAGERIWRGKGASDPSLIAELTRKGAPAVKRVVFETGPLSVWFYHSLRTEGLPAICIDARHAKAALDMAANKTDANDADGLAQLTEVGFFRAVRVKGFDSMLTRTLVAAHTVGRNHHRAFQPDPWCHENLRSPRSRRKRKHLREERPEPSCRSERTCIGCASNAESLAWHSHPRRRTRTQVGPGC